MQLLTTLTVNDGGVSDLTGMQYATNLRSLTLENNNITDISPLAGLTQLWVLDLGGNKVSDLQALAGLTNLRALWIYQNHITDTGALSGLTNLVTLGLYSNQIANVNALAGLTNLHYLYLENNRIQDISALSGLTNLSNVYLTYNFLDISSGSAAMAIISTLQGQGASVTYSPQDAPYYPFNTSPYSGATGVSLTANLAASAFSDPLGTAQAAAEWLVTRVSDGTVVFDSGTDTDDLSSCAVPSGDLVSSTAYSWQVRYENSGGLWSSFSTATNFTTERPPNTPINISPSTGATGVSLTAALTASAFSGPDSTAQAAAEWVVTRVSDGTVVFDSGTDTNDLSNCAVPSGDLVSSTAYSWQVRYENSGGLWSSFSTATNFTTMPLPDLTGILGNPWTLPSSILGGMAISGVTTVEVSNVGTAPLPAGQLVNIQMVARDITNPAKQDIILTTLSNLSVGGMVPDCSKYFSPSINLSAGLPADSYQILVNIIPQGNLVESRTDNNQVSQTAFGQNETIAVATPIVDLAASFGSTLKLPATLQSGGGTIVTVPVIVTNVGNVATLATTPKIEIQVFAVDGVPGDQTLLKTLTGESVSSLANNKSKTFSTTVTLPPGMTPDAYNLEVVEDALNVVTDDTNAANNTFVTSGPAGTFAVTEGDVNLTGTFGTTWTLPPSVVQLTGPLKGNISVVVTNTGDVALPTGQQVNVEMWAYDTTVPGNNPILLGTLAKQSVSNLAPNGKTKLTFSPAVAANTYLPPDTYNIRANIVPLQMTGLPALVESNSDNWVIDPTKTVISSGLFVDLAASFGSTLNLPAGGTSGDGKLITVPVVVTNLGNEPIPTGDKIDIEIDAFDGTTSTLLKLLTAQSVSALGAGKSATFSTTVALPFGLAGGTYNIVANVDTTGVVAGDTNPANNTVTSAAAIAVAQGMVDLSASTLGTSTLPASLASGALLKGTVSVTMKNTGTVAMPIGQSGTIDLMAYNAATDTYVPLGALDGALTAALVVKGTKSFTVSVNLLAGLAAGSYQIEATIAPDSTPADFTAGLYSVLLNSLGKALTITVS
jgi:hypothetical protein